MAAYTGGRPGGDRWHVGLVLLLLVARLTPALPPALLRLPERDGLATAAFAAPAPPLLLLVLRLLGPSLPW
jgi:hypothetical protein